MAFQLKAKESLLEEITRNVRRQIEKAIGHLGAKRETSTAGHCSEGGRPERGP
jgi:hypothetical protein